MRRSRQREFQAALEEAVKALDDDERGFLRLYFVDRLRVEQIGRLWSLDKSNVSRARRWPGTWRIRRPP